MGFLLEQFEKSGVNKPLLVRPNCISRSELIDRANLKAKTHKEKYMRVNSAHVEDFPADFLAAEMLSIPLILGDGKIEYELGEVNFFTSGTEGNPKLVSKTWKQIFSSVKESESLRGNLWFTAFNPLLFAGLQVFAQAVVSGGNIALSCGDLDKDADFLRQQKNFNINATPSWIRNFIIFSDTSSIEPRRIVLGGEAVDQRLLDNLSKKFPHAKITHIYATSELGACFEVRDGKAGIPVELMQDNCKIEDSRLFVKRNGVWIDTADRVELCDGRLIFKGRAADVANVGGRKVSLQDVEELYWDIDGIKDIVAYPVKNSVCGEIVAIDVVCDKSNIDRIKEKIKDISCSTPDKFSVARIVNFVERIQTSAAGKKKRV